ncbi:type VI secretion system secreted protein Hcp [Paenibacillus sp. yr247]|uniref:type VI secretion system tube protein Hcp n=1 Tax=Paenibacillus sp. yr247 TaxID=1761880 RepID=UPI000890BFD3|nr:type VI secretion system tube protein Hcp [Paenibacillus sp. yr247]SDN04304.1 type VI secretion system secreted protein Hcp [Paenibacillus sp. yr247]
MFMLAFSVVPAAAASTGYNMFLKLNGIPGESVTKGYEKWIQIQDVSFEVENSSTAGSLGGGAGAGKAVRKAIAINKNFDISSIPLFMDMVMGKTIDKGQIVFLKSGKETLPVITIDLDKISVGKFNLNNSDETIELNYGAINFIYTAVGPDGKPTNTITGGWDFMKNEKK